MHTCLFYACVPGCRHRRRRRCWAWARARVHAGLARMRVHACAGCPPFLSPSLTASACWPYQHATGGALINPHSLMREWLMGCAVLQPAIMAHACWHAVSARRIALRRGTPRHGLRAPTALRHAVARIACARRMHAVRNHTRALRQPGRLRPCCHACMHGPDGAAGLTWRASQGGGHGCDSQREALPPAAVVRWPAQLACLLDSSAACEMAHSAAQWFPPPSSVQEWVIAVEGFAYMAVSVQRWT